MTENSNELPAQEIGRLTRMVETVHAVFDVIDQAENLEETQGLLLAMVALIEQYMIDNGATKHQAAALVRRALRAS